MRVINFSTFRRGKDAPFSSPLFVRGRNEKRRKRRRFDRRMSREKKEKRIIKPQNKYRTDNPVNFFFVLDSRGTNRAERILKGDARDGEEETHTVHNDIRGKTYVEGRS